MGLRQAGHSQSRLSLRRALVFPVGSGRDGDAETQCAICSGESGGLTMIPLTEDIEILTAGYLSALESNSDEIARLADALRAAEAEGVRYLNERDEARNLLAERVIAHRHVEAERNTATTELITARLALLNAEACRAEAERQMHAAEAMKSRLAQQRLEAQERTEKALEQRDRSEE